MRVVVWGAGGHASVVLDALRGQSVEVVGLLDDSSPASGRFVLGVPVIGGVEHLAPLREMGVTHAHVAVGDCGARLRLADICRAQDFTLLTVIHRTAVIGVDVGIGEGCFIAAHAVIGPRSTLGRCTIINHGSTVDHDSDISEGVHVAPGVHMGGHVEVGAASFIGIGSAVRDRIRIGGNVVVGAGSVVVRDLDAGIIAFGSPARAVPNSNDDGAIAVGRWNSDE